MTQTTADRVAAWRRVGPPLAWAFRVALGVIFIVAAAPKLAQPDAFAWSIAHYRLVPDELINALAICLPWIELTAGVALVLGVAIRANLALVAAMLAVFIGAIGSAMARDLDISCGCFATGANAAAMTHATLTWDIIWLAMTLFALRFDRGLFSVASWRRRNDRS